MKIRTANGVHVAIKNDGSEFVLLEREPDRNCRRFMETMPDCSVMVRGDDIELSNLLPSELAPIIARLHVQATFRSDPSEIISRMAGLKWLLLDTAPVNINFENLPSLQEIRAEWHEDWPSTIGRSNLRSIALYKLPRSIKNLRVLGKLRSLEALELVQANIVDLSGIENFPELKLLSVSYARALADIRAVESLRRIETIEFEACNRISSYEPLSKVASLRKLMVTACSPIPSLKVFRLLRKLEFISFVRTTVLDGDTAMLLDFPLLTFAGFVNKRSYNMRSEAVEANLAARTSGGAFRDSTDA